MSVNTTLVIRLFSPEKAPGYIRKRLLRLSSKKALDRRHAGEKVRERTRLRSHREATSGNREERAPSSVY